jgi:hypothetical protein
MSDPDADLDGMDVNALRAVARQMRQAIRVHRDSSGHDLCWYHPALWALLPDPPAMPEVPDWPQFMRGCVHYRASLDRQIPDAPRIDKDFKP